MIAIMDFKQWSLWLRFMQYISFWLELFKRWTNCPLGLIQLKCKIKLTDKDVSRSDNCPAIKKTSNMIDMDSFHLKICRFLHQFIGKGQPVVFIIGLISLTATISSGINNWMIMVVNNQRSYKHCGQTGIPVQDFHIHVSVFS